MAIQINVGQVWRFNGKGCLLNEFRIVAIGDRRATVFGNCCWKGDEHGPNEHTHDIFEIVRDAVLVSEAPAPSTRHRYSDQSDPLCCQQCGRKGAEDGTVICKPDPNWRAKGGPVKRKHDFSNPYLVNGRDKADRLCVECGASAVAMRNFPNEDCSPLPGWRVNSERIFAVDMIDRDAARRRLRRYDRPAPAAPYRNDVSGIGARLGGYLNVAPERGQ